MNDARAITDANIRMQYLKVTQKGFSFFVSKARVEDLIGRVHFHFREPYRKYSEPDDKDFKMIVNELLDKGASFQQPSDGMGVQRMLDRKRVKDIACFVENDPEAILPTPILLAIDTSRCSHEIPEMDEIGIFELSPEMRVTIVDGQHRLAGLFIASGDWRKDIEVPVVFMLDISISTAARLFQQINGKQKPVNRSVLYDLFGSVSEDDVSSDDDRLSKEYHDICVSLYTDPSSPFYTQIKMLGVGGGAVSQACFIEACKNNLKFLSDKGPQYKYDLLYDYFQLFRDLFPDDWPVPKGFSSRGEIEDHARRVLKERKSQLAKTNGFVAIVKLLGYIYEHDELRIADVRRLVGKVDWTSVEGTGAAAQTNLYRKLVSIINSAVFDDQ